jgi:hypothetical protein
VADTPMHSQTKQGSKCCGCCCDYRRAVIILNVLFIISNVINVIIYTQGNQVILRGLDLDDDGLLDEVEDTYKQQAILAGVGLFASIVAVFGAYRYNVYMVGSNVLCIIAMFITSIVLANEAYNTLEEDYNGNNDIPSPIATFAIQGVFMLLVIYPHVGFMYEVKAAILSEETYPREEFSCCCTPNRRA